MRPVTCFLEKESELITEFNLKNNYVVELLTFHDRPFRSVSSIVTNHLTERKGKKAEFIISFSPYRRELDYEIKGLVAAFLNLYYYSVDEDVVFGDYLLIPNFKLIEGFDYVGLYILHPAYFPNHIPDNYFWLLPIFQSEYEFLHKHGSEKFQNIIESNDPDLTILEREPIV